MSGEAMAITKKTLLFDTVDGSIVLQWFLRQCEACRG